ncbi:MULTISPECIES: DMT family transporter [Flavobacterium]|uniref:DMT family transporter n=1 Tax=Flavobacterium gawalongense TaxID=2594432 RepID=A0A553BDX3_9FLAO|nr:DMT family transporter [Flavobacterium gawalongense]TRW98929.1 DMT family transporter [Flavobacterium gawalongense]TRX03486.1 DMT family transporter [Flavobacterium gawalongense]TRX06449.1 DMT family transporter [Flavobacterium gawalongense]TRX07274.1 DMT family transporter [Flavobacterium gawalongense]TRX25022.1 DMT family transporter [Flavobacterium gawalongense]
MQNDKLQPYLNLHLIVFIWGFTAILGALITITADALVWYRMFFASVFLSLFIVFKRKSFRIPLKSFLKLIFVGLLIALHWITFFKAIHVSNVSITLSVFSLGAFFASLLEPIFYGRKVLWYEVFFGLIIIAGLALIMKVEVNYLEGMLYALVSIILGVLFTLMNGKLIENHDPSVISFYEFMAGVFFITVYFLFQQKFTLDFFVLTFNNWVLILILASICTAYAFTASVKVMQKLTPYTVMLTTNLEPVYGIVLAYFILGGKEKMSFEFYIGAVIIVITVILNGVIKHYQKDKIE